MPWTINDVDKHKKGLSKKEKEKWVKIANAVLGQSKDDVMAIKVANSKTKIMGENTVLEYFIMEMEEMETSPNEKYLRDKGINVDLIKSIAKNSADELKGAVEKNNITNPDQVLAISNAIVGKRIAEKEKEIYGNVVKTDELGDRVMKCAAMKAKKWM